jgi:hypothetical protein
LLAKSPWTGSAGRSTSTVGRTASTGIAGNAPLAIARAHARSTTALTAARIVERWAGGSGAVASDTGWDPIQVWWFVDGSRARAEVQGVDVDLLQHNVRMYCHTWAKGPKVQSCLQGGNGMLQTAGGREGVHSCSAFTDIEPGGGHAVRAWSNSP